MKTLFLTLIIILWTTFDLNAQASFTNPAFACANASIFLSGSTGTISNATFTWSANPAAGALFSSPATSTCSVSFTNAGTYTLTLSVNSGTISSTANNTISIAPLPTVSINASSFTTCISSNFPLAGKQVTLTASGALSYIWNPSPSGGNTSDASQTAQANTNTCYSVTGENFEGCTASAVACVTVIPRFSISATPSTTHVCLSLNGPDIYVELTANNPGSPAFGLPSSHTYIWSGMGILVSPFQSTIKVFPMSTMTFTALIKDSLGCISLPATSTVNAFYCLGIEGKKANLTALSIYPNPVKDILKVEWTSLTTQPLQIEIIDLLGHCVSRFEFKGNSMDITVADLPKGCYLLRLKTRTGVETAKFIKQ